MSGFFHSLGAKIFALISGVLLLFSGSHTAAIPPVQTTAAVTQAVTTQQPSGTLVKSSPRVLAYSPTPLTQPASTPIVPQVPRAISVGSTTQYVTQAELTKQLNELRNVWQNSTLNLGNSGGGIPPATLQAFAASQRIDSLTNTTLTNPTITNATVHGVSGLTDADIPDNITVSNVSASAMKSSFTVDTGQTVTAGDIVAMANNGNIGKWLGSVSSSTPTLPTTPANNNNSSLVTVLDSTHFIYAYKDSANGSKLTAIAGFISGTTLTFGTPVVFSNSTATLTATALASTSATTFVISYIDTSDASKIKAIAGTISSNTTITMGTAVTASNSINTPIMTMLDLTHFVLTYKDSTNSSQTYSVAGTVTTASNSISFGTPVLLSTNTNDFLSSSLLSGNGAVATLDSTHFVAVYRDSAGGTANQTTAIVGSVSANAITFGSAVVATTSTNTLPKNTYGTTGPITIIDSTHFLITFWDSKTSNRLSVIAGLVSGTTVSFGTGVQASTVTNTSGLNVLTLMADSTHFQLAYDNGTQFSTLAGFLNGTNNLTITVGAAINYSSTVSSSLNLTPANAGFLDSTHLALAYSETSNVRTAVVALSGTNNLTSTEGTVTLTAESGACSGNGDPRENSLVIIDSTHYVITYSSSGCTVRSAAASVSGSTVTLGASVVAANTTAVSNLVTYIDSTHYLITYLDTIRNALGAIVGSVNTGASTVAFGSVALPSASVGTTLSSANNVSAAIDSTHFVTVFNDTNNSSKLSAVIGTLSGGVVSYGSTYLLSTSTNSILTVELATTTGGFVVAYKDSNNSSKLSVVAATVSGTTITAGTPTFGVSATTNNPVLIGLDGTHFVVTYTDSTNNSFLTSIAGTVSGTTLTFGTAVVASNSTTNISNNIQSAAVLDSTHFVITYVDTTSNSYVASVVGAISSDTTITFGTSVNTGAVGTPKLAVVDSAHFVLSYIDTTDTSMIQGKLKVVPAYVSGSTITYGSPVVVSNVNSNFHISSLDSTHFVLAYIDTTNNYKGSAIVGLLSGTNNLTATFGSPVVFGSLVTATFGNSSASNLGLISVTDSSHFILAFNNVINSNGANLVQLQTLALSVSGTTITPGTPLILGQAFTSFNLSFFCVLNSTHAVLFYTDGYNSSKITATPITTQSFFSGNLIGIAATSGSAGSSVSVFTGGVVTTLSGLTPGLIYYAQSDGTLGTTPNAYQVGLAISPTSLILKSSDTIANTNTDQFFGDAVFANAFRITESFVQGGLNSLLFKNQKGEGIAELDEAGNFWLKGRLTSDGSYGTDSTTTVQSLLEGPLSSMGDVLHSVLSAISDTVVRMLGEAVYATTGLFDTVFARLINADAGHFSQELCVGATCVTQTQLQALLDKNGIEAASSTVFAPSVSTTTETATSSEDIVSDPVATSTEPVVDLTPVETGTSTPDIADATSSEQ